MKMKNWICLAFILLTGVATVGLSGMEAEAAGKVKLSTKKLTVTVGKKKVLKLKNNKKKVKWTVISGKSKIKLSKKKKTSVTIQGKKKGSVKVRAKVGKKSYTCRITVKAASKKKTGDDKTNNNKTGENNTQDAKKEYTISGYVYSKSGVPVKSSLLTITYGRGTYEGGYYAYSSKVDPKTGKYSIRVKPGVYNIVNYKSESEKTEGVAGADHKLTLPPVTVKNKDVTQNLTLQDECVQTKLLKGDGSPITDAIYVEVDCKKSEAGRIESTATALYPDKNGNILWIRDNSNLVKNYEKYLPDIYYTIFLDEYPLKEIPCLQKDILGATWKYDIFKVEGYITNRGDESRADFDFYGIGRTFSVSKIVEKEEWGLGKVQSCSLFRRYPRYHEMGFYFYAKPGTYYIHRAGAGTRAVGTISVKDQDIKDCHVNFNSYNIHVKEMIQDGSSGYDKYDLDRETIYAFKGDQEYRIDPYDTSENWLEPGTYELKMRKEEYDNYEDRFVTVGSITVTDADQEIDIRY